MTLGQRIQELRKQNQMSQEQLGEQMGVSRQAISKWESDLTIPELDKLIALSKLFQVSLNDLLQVKDESGKPQPQVVLAPSKGWRIAMAVLAVAAAASLALSGFLGWQNRPSSRSPSCRSRRQVSLIQPPCWPQPTMTLTFMRPTTPWRRNVPLRCPPPRRWRT